MERRTILRRTGAVAAFGLAGCLGRGRTDEQSPGGNESQDPGGNESQDGDGGAGDGGVTVVESSVETLGTGCGAEDDTSAGISVDESNASITVSGTYVASNPCQEVVLRDVGYDEARGALVVDLSARATETACVQCLGALDYTARIGFADAVPEDILVTHDGEPVQSTAGVRTPEPRGGSPISGASISVTGIEQGQEPATGADVTFDDDALTVRVAGTIQGSDGCKTAVLEDASYDPDADTLSVAVATADHPDAGDVCTEALVAIEYEAAFEFDGRLPGTVEVSHDGSGVATAGYSEVAAGPTTTTASGPPALADSAFDVISRGPARAGAGVDDIEFVEGDPPQVVVTGTIQGSDGCKTAGLGDVSYDTEADHLSIDVVTRNREGTEGQACTQALVYIDYEVVVTVDGELPSEASVSHDGRGVAGAAWSSAGASADAGNGN